jgi:predicted permease
MRQDILFALRALLRAPKLTLVTSLSLSLGIGATTAVFSLVNALSLRPLWVRDPNSLAVFTISNAQVQRSISFPAFERLRQQQQSFSGLFAYTYPVETVEIKGETEAMGVIAVSGDYYSALGINPIIGRVIEPQDAPLTHPSAKVVVISEQLWKQRFSQNPQVIGEELRINGAPFTIIGVTPAQFSGVRIGLSSKITIPLAALPSAMRANPAEDWASLMGRLKPGVSLEQARAEMELVWPQLLKDLAPGVASPDQRERFLAQKLILEPGNRGTSYIRQRFENGFLALLGVVVSVLVLTCVNVATMLTARAAGRRNEFAIKIALGATRWRLLCQFLAEGILLGAIGAMASLLVAHWGIKILVGFLSVISFTPDLDLSPDLRVFAFGILVAITTVTLITLLPVMAIRPQASLNRRNIGRTAIPGARPMIIAQVALSVIILMAAGLFIRTIHRLGSPYAGLSSDSVLLAQLLPLPGGYRDVDLAIYYRELLDRLRSQPSIQSAGLARWAPLGGYADRIRININEAGQVESHRLYLSPGGLETLGVKLSRGRDFSTLDNDKSSKVCILSQGLARRLFGDKDALGQMVRVGQRGDTKPGSNPESVEEIQVIGVVPDVNLYDLRSEGSDFLYMPYFQQPRISGYSVLLVRSKGSALSLTPIIRREVRELRREHILWTRTLTEQVDRALAQERLGVTVCVFFGLVALTLASLGIYGVINYSVEKRISEIGLRVALGAQGKSIVWLVLYDAFVAIVIGISFGVLVGMVAMRLASKLISVPVGNDFAAVLIVITVLLAVGVGTSLFPAMRALKIDPAVLLKYE